MPVRLYFIYQMKKNIIKYIRLTVLIQFCTSAIVLAICWLKGWFYLYTIGIVYTWAGVLILLVNAFVVFGGMLSSGEGLSAFSLSGAGKLVNHIRDGREAGSNRLIFIIFGLSNGIIPVLIGYILQTLGQ